MEASMLCQNHIIYKLTRLEFDGAQNFSIERKFRLGCSCLSRTSAGVHGGLSELAWGRYRRLIVLLDLKFRFRVK